MKKNMFIFRKVISIIGNIIYILGAIVFIYGINFYAPSSIMKGWIAGITLASLVCMSFGIFWLVKSIRINYDKYLQEEKLLCDKRMTKLEEDLKKEREFSNTLNMYKVKNK